MQSIDNRLNERSEPDSLARASFSRSGMFTLTALVGLFAASAGEPSDSSPSP